MSASGLAAVALVGVAMLTTLVVVPLLLPWRQQLRLLTSLHNTSCAWTSASMAAVCLDEVVPIQVRPRSERITVWLLTQPLAALVTVEVPRTPATLALLEQWVRRAEPLLLTTTVTGQASLSRQSESITILPPDATAVAGD